MTLYPTSTEREADCATLITLLSPMRTTDHTAELETLLMLLHRRNRDLEGSRRQRVTLYLSEGCQRKFCGLIALRMTQRSGRFIRLPLPCVAVLTSSPWRRISHSPFFRRIMTMLSLARALVGLGLQIAAAGSGARRIVFTGDTGCYPRVFGTPRRAVVLRWERPRTETRYQRRIWALCPVSNGIQSAGTSLVRTSGPRNSGEGVSRFAR